MVKSITSFQPDIRRYLFGDDIFVSYSRRDGLSYALSLATSLSAFRCYVDQLGSVPSSEVPSFVLRRLQRSTVLVLVGTNAAAHSDAVRQEIETFIKTRRPIIPISFSGEIERSPLARLLPGLPFTPEPLEAAVAGSPSAGVIARVEASVNYTRHAIRIRRFLRGVAISTLALVLGTGVYQAASMYVAHRREQCRLVKSGLDNHSQAEEYYYTWPDAWEQERAHMEAEVEQVCGKDGRWDPVTADD